VNNTIVVTVSITGAWKPVIRENSIAITFMIVATQLLTCWFVRADCSTADEPGQVPQIGGLSNFGKVSTKKIFASGTSTLLVPLFIFAMT